MYGVQLLGFFRFGVSKNIECSRFMKIQMSRFEAPSSMFEKASQFQDP